MQTSRPAAHHLAITTFHDEYGPQFTAVAALGPAHEITTQAFAIAKAGGGIEPRQRTAWEQHAPPDAPLFIATCGRRLEEVRTMWVGWIDRAGLHALSAYHEQPFTVPVAPGSALALPPVVVASGRMHAFVFTSQAGGWSLVRHELRGEANQPVSDHSETLSSAHARPVLSAAAAVPGVRDRDLVIVGWVDAIEAGSRVSVAVAAGAAAKPATLELPKIRPVGGRLALQMTPSSDAAAKRPAAIQLAFVGELLDHTGYISVVVDLVVATQQFHIATTPIAVPAPRRLVSGFVALPRYAGGTLSTYAVRDDSVLIQARAGVQRSRRGVGGDYDFPIEIDGFEPRIDGSGAIVLAPIAWDGP